MGLWVLLGFCGVTGCMGFLQRSLFSVLHTYVYMYIFTLSIFVITNLVTTVTVTITITITIVITSTIVITITRVVTKSREAPKPVCTGLMGFLTKLPAYGFRL